jgi:hypothetical protein
LAELSTITAKTFCLFVDIGGIVDHHCDGQQFLRYQETKRNFNSDGQQFYHYQQMKRKYKQ